MQNLPPLAHIFLNISFVFWTRVADKSSHQLPTTGMCQLVSFFFFFANHVPLVYRGVHYTVVHPQSFGKSLVCGCKKVQSKAFYFLYFLWVPTAPISSPNKSHCPHFSFFFFFFTFFQKSFQQDKKKLVIIFISQSLYLY